MLAHIFVEKAHNVLGDRERARRCGRRRVQDMDDVVDALDAEIVHEVAVRLEGHRAHTGAAYLEIIACDLRDEAFEPANEGALRERSVIFESRSSPMLYSHAPETGETQHLAYVSPVDIQLAIAFPLERQHRVRTRLDLSVDAPRRVKCTPRKGKRGSGTG